jgi:hypothetical protein
MKCFYHLESEAVAECKSCGKALCMECSMNSLNSVCQKCEKSLKEQRSAKSVMAGILSTLCPGLGQLTRGEFIKATAFFVLTIFSMSKEIILLGLIIWTAAVWDGFKTIATEEELGLKGGSKRWVAGVLLIFFGMLLIPGPLKQFLRIDLVIPAILVVYGLALMARDKPARSDA